MLNLGDIVFGLNADTKGLRNAVARLELFQKHVDQVTRSTTIGGQKFSRAFAAQERSIRAAIAATAQLVSELRRVGATPADIGRATLALTNLQRTMQKGALDAVAFSRAQDKFNASAGRTKRAINQLQPKAATKSMGKFSQVMKNLESSSVLAIGPLSGLGARIRALSAITSRSAIGIALMLAAIAGLVVGVVKLAQAAIRSRVEIEKMEAGFLAATGSVARARIEFEFTANVAKKFGLNLKTVGQEYSKLAAAAKGSNLAGEDTRRIFHAVATASTALRLTTDETAGAFRAIQQMISKGNVQAEELRGQWGERIPGGFRLAALAMKVTTKRLGELLKAGKIVADDLLPKMARVLEEEFGAAAAEAADSVAAATDRLSTSFLLFSKAFDDATNISSVYKLGLEALTKTLDSTSEALQRTLTIEEEYTRLTGRTVGAAKTLLETFEAMQKAANEATKNEYISFLAKVGKLSDAAGKATEGARDKLNRMVSTGKASDEMLRKQSTAVVISSIEWKKYKTIVDETEKVYADFLETIGQGPDKDTPGELSKATLKAIEDVDKLLVKFVDFEQILGTIDTGGGAAAVHRLEAVHDAARKLIDVPDAEKSSIIKMLQFLDPLATTAEALIAELVLRVAALKKVADAAINRFEKLPEALREAGDEINRILSEAFATARGPEVLKQFNEELERSDAIKDFRDELEEAGANQGELNEETNRYIAALNELDAVQKRVKLAEGLKEASDEMNRLLRETSATMAGPGALKKFNEGLERSDAIEKFRDNLEKAGANQQQLNEATRQYIDTLEGLDAAQVDLERLNATIKIIEKTTERAFNRIGSAITEAFVKGESDAIQFGNIVMAVLGEIMQTLLQISLFQPLTQAFVKAITPGGGGGPTPGDIAGTPFGMGGAWDNVRKAAKGMVLGGPTMFGGIGGSKVLGGERGPEALMPLDRISGGKLGVNVEGAHPITINVHNNAGADIAIQQRQQSGGGLSVDIMIDRAVARALRRGGEASAAVPELFNTSPRVISR